MMGVLEQPRRWLVGVGAAVLVLFALAAGSARAAVYPAGGSTFSGGLEGWKVMKSSCTLALGLCNNSAGYEANAGNPAGSLRSETSILLNLLNLFKGETVFESPGFTVGDSGAGVVSLQRSFSNSNLVKLGPQLQYTVSLVDKSAGTATEAVAETLTGESTFLAKQGTAPLIAGHTYAIVIAATTSSTAELLGITGAARALFDNVSVTTSKSDGGGGGGAGGGGNSGGGAGNNGGGAGGAGGKGGAGQGSLSNSRLATLIRSSMVGNVRVRGKRVFVKAKCPAKVHAACSVTVQGLLRKGKPATAPRTAKIAKGKAKQLVLRVKPKLRKAVAKRRKLLFKQTVRARGAKATVYKRIKLIRHR